MGKNKDKIRIEFIGNNATGVTGSMILITTDNDKQILLECGMIQSANSILDYKENAKPFPCKAKNIDYLFLNHVHADHLARTPKLVKDGFDGKIIATPITAKLMKPMLLDSANIIRKDSEYISKKRNKDIEPYYNEDDVYNTLDITYEYGYDKIYTLDDEISFKFLRNSHLIGSAQLELYITKKSGHICKILYTSDLGGTKIKNHYVDDLEFCEKTNIVISECTYGSKIKDHNINRNKDIEKISTIIDQVCIQDKGRILIPVFSLGRSHQILTDLYMMYGEDKSFNIPIVVDSPLIWELTKLEKQILEGENKILFEKVCNWKNVRFIKDYNESKISVLDRSPKIVLSSSGFLIKGRSVSYLREYIENVRDHVLSVGYAPPNSVAGKIKNGQKYITVDGVSYKNKCGLTVLNSYSSHIQRSELLNYLKTINCEKYYLVHGDMDAKLEFKESLEEELSKMDKTSKVIATNNSTVCSL